MGGQYLVKTSCLAKWINSSLFLKAYRDGASTTSGGKEFQLFTILKEAKNAAAGLGNISDFSTCICAL